MSADKKKVVSNENLAAFAEALAAKVPLKSDLPTKVSDLANDTGFTTNEGTITSVTLNGTTTSSGGVNLGYLVVQESGKRLSSNDYTTLEKEKLAGIEAGAEANIIETVRVNGTAQTPDASKAIDISVPTTVAELSDASNYALSADLEEAEYVTSQSLNDLNSRVITLEDAEFVETDPTVPAWAKEATKPTYTASEVGALPSDTVIPSKTSELQNDSGFLTSHQDISGKQDILTFDTVPTENSSNPVTSGGLYTVITDNELVTSTALNDLNTRVSDLEEVTVPTKTSDLTNDSGFITSESDPTVPAWAKASTKPAYTAAEVGALPDTTVIPDVSGFFDEVSYDSGTKRINFKQGTTIKKYIDATDFIKDGMVDSVEIATPESGSNAGVSCLVVTFNTDAGKEDIEIPLSSIFNPSNYYTKTEAENLFVLQDDLAIDSIPSEGSTNLITSGGVYTAIVDNELVVSTALNDLNTRLSGIENTTIPTKTSDLTNDSGFLTSHQDISGKANTADLATVAISGSYNDLSDKPTIPSAVTESTVSGWGFTKNTGTYSKPSGGIPVSDLESAVQTSLGKADTALQSYTETDPVFSASPAAGISASDITNWNSKTSNTGTLTGVSFNGVDATITSGVAAITATIPSAPGTLDTTATTAQTTSASEALSGNITLHKVAKTGSYSDLIGAPGGNAKIFYGTCSTSSSSYTKEVVCSDFKSTDLVDGALIFVTFTNTNTADPSELKLSVNRTLIRGIYTYYGEDGELHRLRSANALHSGGTYLFSYGGGYGLWILLTSDYNTDTQANWNETSISSPAYIQNKPTIPDAVTESTVSGWGFTKNSGTITGITMNGSSKGTSGIIDLGTVLTSHQDISGKQDVISDLETIRSNAAAGASKVSNIQSDWNATTGLGVILNKPTIPTVNDSTITVQMNGAAVDTFTVNQGSNKTINLGTVITAHQDISGKANVSDLGSLSDLTTAELNTIFGTS